MRVSRNWRATQTVLPSESPSLPITGYVIRPPAPQLKTGRDGCRARLSLLHFIVFTRIGAVDRVSARNDQTRSTKLIGVVRAS
jgi:hypothetical protein